MIYTHSLVSELSIDLDKDQEAYIHIKGHLATCLLSLELIDVDATAVIQSSIASTTLFESATLHSELAWENIVVGGIEYVEVTFAISSVLFNSPSILYIRNSSATDKTVRLSLKGNR